MSITTLEPIKVVRNVLVAEMNLKDSQVMFSNQKFDIPTLGLYLYLSYLGPSVPIARNSELVQVDVDNLVELQTLTMLSNISISIMAYNDASGGNQARSRYHEIQMALGSFYSEQQQELYGLQIARHVQPFVDTSFLEETEMITRYTTMVRVTSLYQKQQVPSYFDQFSAQLYTDNPVAGPIDVSPAAVN